MSLGASKNLFPQPASLVLDIRVFAGDLCDNLPEQAIALTERIVLRSAGDLARMLPRFCADVWQNSESDYYMFVAAL